jgi:hypothetical protein
MSLDTFLRDLFDDGRVVVPAPEGDEGDGELAAAGAALDAFEHEWRLEFPGMAPVWRRDVALHGARLLYRAAQAAVFRDIDETALRSGFDLVAPADLENASAHYSIDLTLRFLPDLTRMAQGAAANDPLVELLGTLACRWPLSSVGVAGVVPASIDVIAGHPGLLRLYVDRVLGSNDAARLTDERVAEAARQALGAHADLAASLSGLLTKGARP